MNVYSPVVDRDPNRDEAEAALAVLRNWTETAADNEITDLDPALLKLLPVLRFASDLPFHFLLPPQDGEASPSMIQMSAPPGLRRRHSLTRATILRFRHW